MLYKIHTSDFGESHQKSVTQSLEVRVEKERYMYEFRQANRSVTECKEKCQRLCSIIERTGVHQNSFASCFRPKVRSDDKVYIVNANVLMLTACFINVLSLKCVAICQL